MFKIFKKQPIGPLRGEGPGEFTRLWQKYVHALLSRIAAFLSARERKMSIAQKKRALVIYCVLLGAFSTTLLCHGLFSAPPPAPGYLHLHTITQPRSIQLPESAIRQKQAGPPVTAPDTAHSLK